MEPRGTGGEGEVCVVLSTFESADDAARVGRELVARRLAACVNIVPGVRSIYRWQGQVEDAGEVLAVVKTRQGRLRELVAALTDLHPYTLPEILVLPSAGGSGAYAAWVIAETSPGSAPGA